MTDTFDRKAATRAYKERKVRPGIYAVRDTVSSGRPAAPLQAIQP